MRSGIVKVLADHKQTLKRILPMRFLRFMKKRYIQHTISRYSKEPVCKEEFQKKVLGVNLIGDIRAEIGLGQSMRLIANELELSKYPFGIYNFQLEGNLRRNDTTWDYRIREDYPYSINLFHINPQEVGLAYLYLNKDIWRNHYNIAFWLWELEEFPGEYIGTLKFFDEIWTPSEFSSASIRKVTDKPVYTVPYYVIVDVDKMTYNRAYFGLPENQFLYLIMYDTNSTMERKNPVGALNAYKKAYLTEDSNVGLVIKVNNATEEDLKVIRSQIKGYRNVYLITQIMDKIQVNSLIADVDVFVSLHRAEGFGLVMVEAMMSGTACIATNWSSNTEFMDSESACMVSYHKVEIQRTAGIYTKGSVWAEANIDEAAMYMRKLYEDKEYYDRLVDIAKKRVNELLGIERVVQIVEERIKEVGE